MIGRGGSDSESGDGQQTNPFSRLATASTAGSAAAGSVAPSWSVGPDDSCERGGGHDKPFESHLERPDSLDTNGSEAADKAGEMDRGQTNPFSRRRTVSTARSSAPEEAGAPATRTAHCESGVSGGSVPAGDAANRQANPFNASGGVEGRQSNRFDRRHSVGTNLSSAQDSAEATHTHRRAPPRNRPASPVAASFKSASDFDEGGQVNPFSAARVSGGGGVAPDRAHPRKGSSASGSAAGADEAGGGRPSRQANPFARRGPASSAGGSVVAGDEHGSRTDLPDPFDRSGSVAADEPQDNPFRRILPAGAARSATPESFGERRPSRVSSRFRQSNASLQRSGSTARSSLQRSASTIGSVPGSVGGDGDGEPGEGGAAGRASQHPYERPRPAAGPFRPRRMGGLATVEDSSERSVSQGGQDPAQDPGQANPFGMLKRDRPNERGGGTHDVVNRNRLCDEEDFTEHNTLDNTMDDADKVIERTAPAPRHTVKHRHCKAAAMVCVVWSVTVMLISMALGLDWFAAGPPDLCTLCGENGLEFLLDRNKTDGAPTAGRPPSPGTAFGSKTIDPPPADLAKVCAPSIRLHRGPDPKGLSSRDLMEGCIRACLPALCCLVHDEEIQGGLLSMIAPEIGVDEAQALAYISTVDDCYAGGDIPVCDAYNEWCATLYSLDHALEESLPAHFFDTCHRTVATADHRASDFAAADRDCEELCRPLDCCYDGARKRGREHKHRGDGETTFHFDWRRRAEGAQGGCQHFDAEVPVNRQICDAYTPFCSPNEHKQPVASTFTLTFPVADEPPVPAPSASFELTHPSITAPPDSLHPASGLLEANDNSASLSLVFSVPSESKSTPTPSSQPSLRPSLTFSPSSDSLSSSTAPSFQPSTTNFPSGKSEPTLQPSPSETPTAHVGNVRLNVSAISSTQPSAHPP